ncbi:MAG: MBL fold metallo-hydrolase [bacterium]|nr:MBL fold metallo-hydrolase [bacterium]
MVITWYGKNCFKLQSGDLVIVTDPFEKEGDLAPFRGRADIIIKTIAPLSNEQNKPAEAFEISYPGEYEIKNVSINGWSLPGKDLRSVYSIEIDDLKIVLLGHLAEENEIKKIQEYLEDADIIFVPAGGKPFIEKAAAAKLIRQLKPSLIVPTLFENFKDIKSFLEELGQNGVEPQEKLTIGKKDLSKEKLIIGCLKI